MKKIISLMILISLTSGPLSYGQSSKYPSTWANWERKLDKVFKSFPSGNLPGNTMGILVPGSERSDILPLTAHGYEVMPPPKSGTIIIIMSAPDSYPLNGIVMPERDSFSTSFGQFQVDGHLRETFHHIEFPIFLDDRAFGRIPSTLLATQFAAVKYTLRGGFSSTKFLPMMVNFNDPNSQVKDLGAFLAETISDEGLEEFVKFVVAADLTQAQSEGSLVPADSEMLSAIRNMDVDGMLELRERGNNPENPIAYPDFDPLALGVLTQKWLGGDHGKILSYAHSSQLVLTKDKSKVISFAAAGFASDAPFPPRIPHVEREKIVSVFDELFRSEILTMIRQTVLSILDPTAAKPPTLLQKEAGKKWPAYVSIYDAEGKILGEKGSHVGTGPLEAGLRQFAFEAVRQAGRSLTKENAPTAVVEVSIPHGFNKVTEADELIPLLNGIVVHKKRKTYGFHPNKWRQYPNPHQLLGAICFELGLKPWTYATTKAQIESFRIVAFNEKEPFQDFGAEKRKKKKKKKKKGDDFGDDFEGDGNFDDAGAFPF